jgi:hypothetical protein
MTRCGILWRIARIDISIAFVLTVLILLPVSGCKGYRARQEALSAASALSSSDVPPASPTRDEPQAAEPASSADTEREDRPRSNLHPAAFERDYGYLDSAAVALDPAEREWVQMMTMAQSAERAFRQIRKEGAGRFPFLRRAIRHPHREVRNQAAIMLGLLKDTSDETINILLDALLLDRDPEVRATVAKAFVTMKANQAVPQLIRVLLEDPHDAARSNAAWALGSLRSGTAAIDPLRTATKDENTFVRLRAVSALKKLKPKSAVPELIDRLEDSSPMVRERARDALKAITGRDKGSDPDKWRR